jgi:acyl carrier protein
MTNPATNHTALVASFAKSLAIAPERVVDTLAYNAIAEWDSTAHMLLVSELEGAFGVMLDTDDIIDLSSVAKAKEILGKHGVTFP